MYKFFILILLLSFPAQASLLISYDSLYRKMKTLQKPEYSDLTLAFLLTNTERNTKCRYIDLRLVSDLHNIELYLSANGEISLPFDEVLKDSKARLVLQQADNHARCELTLVLRTRMPLAVSIQQRQLVHYQQQFKLVLADLAGSVSKRWLPEIKGLIVVFTENVNPSEIVSQLTSEQQAATQCKQNRCQIDLTALTTSDELWTFKQKPAYLLPLMQQ